MARWYTVPLSVLVHAVLLAAAIAVPVLATDALPTPASVLVFLTPPPSPTPPIVPVASHVRAPSTLIRHDVFVEHPSTPDVRAFVPALEMVAPMPIVGDASAIRTFSVTPPEAPSFAPIPTPAPPIRVGGIVKSPLKTFDEPPVYPAVARLARVEGTVILEATIDREGAVSDVHVLRSVPMLDEAAVTAVRHWRYTPSRLNGEPVAVLMTVTVRFSLH